MNHETLYLKEAFGSSIEFLNEAGVFQRNAFPNLTAFIVLSEEPYFVQANFASSPNLSTVASTPNTSTITTILLGNLLRRALTTSIFKMFQRQLFRKVFCCIEKDVLYDIFP